MDIKNSVKILVCIALALPLSTLAQPKDELLHSGWLELVKGYRDPTVGAQMQSIEEDATTGGQKITLSIPKISMRYPDSIEEVVVTGQRQEKLQPITDISYEWLRDYDNDNYGLVIRLSKDTQWPIRLYFYSDPGFVK